MNENFKNEFSDWDDDEEHANTLADQFGSCAVRYSSEFRNVMADDILDGLMLTMIRLLEMAPEEHKRELVDSYKRHLNSVLIRSVK